MSLNNLQQLTFGKILILYKIIAYFAMSWRAVHYFIFLAYQLVVWPDPTYHGARYLIIGIWSQLSNLINCKMIKLQVLFLVFAFTSVKINRCTHKMRSDNCEVNVCELVQTSARYRYSWLSFDKPTWHEIALTLAPETSDVQINWRITLCFLTEAFIYEREIELLILTSRSEMWYVFIEREE